MKEEIEKLLLLLKEGDASKGEAEAMVQQIREEIKRDAARGKELGRYMALLGNAVKNKVGKLHLEWGAVNAGWLSIGHKPGGKVPFDGLKQAGTTAILTLLQQNEGAEQIGAAVEKAGMEWIWFPFSASAPHEAEAAKEVILLYNKLEALLTAGGKIYIHCSAGIHRTGMITYGLLRYLGMHKAEAVAMLRRLREVTADQVGDSRLLWGDQFVK